MKLKLLLLNIIVLFSVTIKAQNISEHYRYSYKGDSLIDANQILEAKKYYIKALKFFNKDYETHQSLAAIYIRSKNFKNADKHLKLAISQGITLARLTNDTTIKRYFKENPLWSDLYKKLHQDHFTKIPFHEERTVLIQMIERDQTLRGLLGVLNYKIVDSLIHKEDLANMEKIKVIINKIGFPDRNKVGNDGADAVFILLMHTLNSGVNQQENSELIFPLMEKAVKEGNFTPYNYAILVDRQKGINKEKQVFGTYWEIKGNKRIITPIENINSVNRRRTEIGLPNLSYSSKKIGLVLPENYSHNN